MYNHHKTCESIKHIHTHTVRLFEDIQAHPDALIASDTHSCVLYTVPYIGGANESSLQRYKVMGV